MQSFKVERMDEKAKRASSNSKNDFSEYMWMADLDSFDRKVRSEIEEENYIRSSIELLLDEEEQRESVYYNVNNPGYDQGNGGFYFNGQQGQCCQPEYVYDNENLEYPMATLELNQFDPQQHYYADQQAMVNPQDEWSFYPPNEILPPHMQQNITQENGFQHQQNGYHHNMQIGPLKNQLSTVPVSS